MFERLAREDPRFQTRAEDARLAFRVANWPPAERQAARASRLTRAQAAQLLWWMVPEVREAKVKRGRHRERRRLAARQPAVDPRRRAGPARSRPGDPSREPRRPPLAVGGREAAREASRDSRAAVGRGAVPSRVRARSSHQRRGGAPGPEMRPDSRARGRQRQRTDVPPGPGPRALGGRRGDPAMTALERLKGPFTLPNFITLLRLAVLPFFLFAIADGRLGIALVIFVVAGHLRRHRRLPRPALRHEVRARRLSRPDRRQAPDDELVSLPRGALLSGGREGSGLAGSDGDLAGHPPDDRRRS